MLSSQEIAFFETFGYLVAKGLFSQKEMKIIQEESDSILDEDRGGEKFSGEGRQAVLGFVERRPFLSTLPSDERIFDRIEDLLGNEFMWIGGDGNLYVGDTHWHSDSTGNDYEFGFDRIKVALYLDPVKKESGCLRVVPGSHKIQLHQQLEPLRHLRLTQKDAGGGDNMVTTEQLVEQGITSIDPRPFGVSSNELPATSLESEPGDVVFFNHRLWHSSFGGKTSRRMFTLNFCVRPNIEEDFQTLRDNYQHTQGMIKSANNPTGQVYSDAFHNSKDPKIKRMMSIPKELNFK